MLKRIVRNTVIVLLGFTIAAPFALAQEPSLPAAEKLIEQIEALRTEVFQIRETADEARDIAVDSRLESQKFKEETLYRLALWRGRLGEGMMMSIAAQDAAERAEKMGETALDQVAIAMNNLDELKKEEQMQEEKLGALSQNIDALKRDVSLAKEMAATAKAQADQAVKRLEQKVSAVDARVDALKTDVSLAKEMAATAKAQADQARKEVRELAGQVRKDRELFLRKIEECCAKAKEWEEKLKPEKVELKAPSAKMTYSVKKGDSLWGISAQPDVYNDPAHWKKIFEANKDRLISPDRLYPGQKLVIP